LSGKGICKPSFVATRFFRFSFSFSFSKLQISNSQSVGQSNRE
jgi:hypothetical protein